MHLQWLLTLLPAALAVAQSIVPSNSTTRGPSQDFAALAMAIMAGDGRTLMDMVDVVPLSDAAGAQLPSAGLRGAVVPVDPNSLPNVTSQDIAYISCDSSAYPGNINVVDTLASVVSSNVTAAVLFSQDASYCNYTNGSAIDASYPFLYSMTDRNAAAQVYAGLTTYGGQFSMNDIGVIQLRSSLESAMNQTNNNGNGNNNDQNSNNNPLGPSPSTAVAMIILYSITGVITALFLVIIITGAIRAHRHPERYGPRDGAGRPRQSRARGIARAMLETIPIVKFGDPEPPKPTDVELAEARAAQDENSAQAVTSEGSEQRQDGDRSPHMTEHRSGSAADLAAATATVAGGAGTPSPKPAEPPESLGCSICTDDFERGQDIRVLPCDHKFHPACIDPWLLNVSGTCPLCRIDLRPTTSRDSQLSADAGVFGRRGSRNSLAPPLEESDNTNVAGNRQSRLGRFGDLLRLRGNPDSTPQERIAALRQLREQTEGQTEDPAEMRRRHRLTARLHDVFSVRTRRDQSSSREDVSEEPDTGAGASRISDDPPRLQTPRL